MRLLLLTFYFEPDLCAGSFRNKALLDALKQNMHSNDTIDVVTTIPNRYRSYSAEARPFEKQGNITIHRIKTPPHKSGFLDQIFSFKTYYRQAIKLVNGKNYDIVIASSSRLFTAFLGARIARKKNTMLYLDIRDIFTDTMNDVLNNKALKLFTKPVLSKIEQYTIQSASHLNLVSKGFEPYFQEFYDGKTSFYTNGIDELFLDYNYPKRLSTAKPRVITYAGNIGEGQGLEKIIPQAASKLANDYHFNIIGDGGSKNKLAAKLKEMNVNNVELIRPMKRKDLLIIYSQSDYLFLHLNDYDAFKKVLPSKIFEYGATPLPMIAGVGGYAQKFINENVNNAIVFSPNKADEFVQKLLAFKPEFKVRHDFIKEYRRIGIMDNMAQSILQLKINGKEDLFQKEPFHANL
ncbi:MAG: glycosyltransferase family 4 protein [Balneolales bacterium]